MSSRRLIRVAEVIRSELGRLIARQRGLEDALLTITGVDITPDLKNAFVYVSSLSELYPEQQILSMLESHRSEWQSVIGSKMHIKFTPRLSFRFDPAQQRGDRIMQILDSIDVPPDAPS